MEKLNSLTILFCDNIPSKLKYGILYISEKFKTSTHLCACGCGQKTVLPLGDPSKGVMWNLTKNNDNTISLTPSIGNFSGQNPYHAHYFITNNQIAWS